MLQNIAFIAIIDTLLSLQPFLVLPHDAGAVIMKLTEADNEQVVALSKKLVERWKTIADEYVEEKKRQESEAAAAAPAVGDEGDEVVLEDIPAPCSLGELPNQVTSEAMELEEAPQTMEAEAPEAMEVEDPETIEVEEMKDIEQMEVKTEE